MRRGWMTVLAAALLWPAGSGLRAQEAAVTGSEVSLAAGAATLELELADGSARVVTLRDGQLLIDGEVSGEYEPGGGLDGSWRALLTSPALFEGSDLADRLAEWVPESGGEADAASASALEALFDRLAEGADRTAANIAPDAGAAQEAEVGGGGPVAIAPGTVTSISDLTRRVGLMSRQLERLGGEVGHIEDNLALLVHDDFTIGAGEQVDGNVAVLSGDLDLEGTVGGDVLLLDGSLNLGPSARIEGDVLQVGGDLVDAGGTVAGEIVSLVAGDLADLVSGEIAADLAEDVEVPVHINIQPGGRGFFGSIGYNISRAIGGVLASLVWLLALAFLGFIVVYFFRSRLEVVAEVVRADTARSFGVGLAGQLLVLPILLVLVVGIITWLVIPVFALAVALAIPAGYLAVAHALGEAAQEQDFRWLDRFHLRRATSYHYVFTGLIFLVAPFAIGSALYVLGGHLGFVRGLMFFAAGLLTWAALTTGFGGILITRAGSRGRRASRAEYEDLFSAPDSFDTRPEEEASA